MKICPTCKRPVGGRGRSCFACGMPILRGHKWHVNGCYVQHDDCANPTMRLLIHAPEPQPTAQIDLQPAAPDTTAEEPHAST